MSRRLTILLGVISSDIRVKNVGGKKLAEFSVPIDDEFNKDITHWHQCKAWGKTAEMVEKYMKKGTEAMFEGRTSLSQWEDKDGVNKAYLRFDVDRITFTKKKHKKSESYKEDEPF